MGAGTELDGIGLFRLITVGTDNQGAFQLQPGCEKTLGPGNIPRFPQLLGVSRGMVVPGPLQPGQDILFQGKIIDKEVQVPLGPELSQAVVGPGPHPDTALVEQFDDGAEKFAGIRVSFSPGYLDFQPEDSAPFQQFKVKFSSLFRQPGCVIDLYPVTEDDHCRRAFALVQKQVPAADTALPPLLIPAVSPERLKAF